MLTQYLRMMINLSRSYFGGLELVSMLYVIPIMLAGPTGIIIDTTIRVSILSIELCLAFNGNSEKEAEND
jgi:hypothetical protein